MLHPVWQGLKDTCWATILYMVSIDRHVVLSLQKYNSQHSQTCSVNACGIKIPSESIKAGKHILQCKLIWRYSFSYLADEHTHTIQYIVPMRVGHIASKHCKHSYLIIFLFLQYWALAVSFLLSGSRQYWALALSLLLSGSSQYWAFMLSFLLS